MSSGQALTRRRPALRAGNAALGLAALGVVFGDIGTSPLYTLKTVFALTGGQPSPETILGVLSLVVWTLVVVTTVKYVAVAMSIDNDGEGGILALMALLGVKRARRPRGSRGAAAVARSAVRLHAAQFHARDGLFPAAAGVGCGDRTPGRGLN